MVRIKFNAIALSICLLVACAPSTRTIQTAIVQTQVSIPTLAATLTSTPLPDITSVILANGFVLGPNQSHTSGKDYQIVNEQRAIISTAVVYYNGVFSLTSGTIDEEQKMKIINIFRTAYGSAVGNWVAPVIEGKDFSQPFQQNGSAGGYNIEITITGQVGWRSLNLTIMPSTQ